MDNLVNIDTIINWLTEQVEQKLPIDAHTWSDAALKMNILLQSEHEAYFLLEQEVARLRKTWIEDGKTVAYAKTMVEATDEYRNARVKKAKIERCLEAIKLVKLNVRIASDLMRHQM